MQRDIGNYGSSGIDHAENHLFSTSPALTPLLPQLNSSLQYHQDCNRLLLARLQEASKQAQGLRHEKIYLRMVNDVLAKVFQSIVRVASGLPCVSRKTDSNVSSIDTDQIVEEQRDIGNYGSSGNYGTSSSAPFVNHFYNNFSSLIDHAENHLFSTSPSLTPLLPQLNSSNRLLLARLQEVSKQAQGLRQENITLRTANDVLAKAIESTVSATWGLTCVSGQTDSNVSSIDIDQIVEELRKLDPAEEFVEENDNQEPGTDDMEARGTKAVQDGNSSDNVDKDLLPKSIGVPSREYLKAASQGSSGGKIAITGQNMSKSGNEAQKVYVPGVVEKEQPLEVEEYNQGMFKTEVCNKWQQVGTCPYGGNCQFAHGLDELRPVLRQPRYRTEVCRMVLNGDPCPYGHRCHFRHILTDEEKHMRSNNGNSLNDNIGNTSSYTA